MMLQVFPTYYSVVNKENHTWEELDILTFVISEEVIYQYIILCRKDIFQRPTNLKETATDSPHSHPD